MVRIVDTALAKKVLTDNETFKHQIIDLVKHSDKFIGHDHLVGINDSQWKRQRKVLDPAFKSLGNYFDIFAKKTSEVLGKMVESDVSIVEDVHLYTQAMALDILGLSIFGHDFKSVSMEQSESLASYNYLMGLFFNIKKALPAMITHHFNSLPSTKETLRQLAIWGNLRSSLIELSKKRILDKSIDHSNYSMLDMMVESNLQNDEEEKLTEKEIMDNTRRTANALAFGIQVLAQYPEIQSKLRKEINENIEKVDRESIETLPYLSCFIKELLRMYPPIASIPAKIASKDTMLGDYFIPKGTLVSVSVLNVHSDETIYENPDQFIPERWDKNATKKIPHSAWIPFSSGSRVCIGNNFSLMEQKIFFVELLKGYDVTLVDPTQKVAVSGTSGIIQSPNKIGVKFTKL